MDSENVYFIASSGVSGLSLLGAVEMLNTSNRIHQRISGRNSKLFNPIVCSIDGKPVNCASGQEISVDRTADEIPVDSIIFIPAHTSASREDIDALLKNNSALISWLESNAKKMEKLAANCSAVFFLAEANLLEGHPVTTAWFLANEFRVRYPSITLEQNALSVSSDNISTAGASTAYQDLVLQMIEKKGGKHIARLLAKYLMIDNQRSTQAPFAILSATDSQDSIVKKAENWIRKNLSTEFSIDEIAQHIGVSQRTLIRHFQSDIHESPQSLTQKLRIEKSKILLETTELALPDIVQRVGYSDESAFRRIFKRHCQLSPREYRRRFSNK